MKYEDFESSFSRIVFGKSNCIKENRAVNRRWFNWGKTLAVQDFFTENDFILERRIKLFHI